MKRLLIRGICFFLLGVLLAGVAQANVVLSTESLSQEPTSFVYTITGLNVAGVGAPAVPSTYSYQVALPFWKMDYSLTESKDSAGYDKLSISGLFGWRSNPGLDYTTKDFSLILSAATPASTTPFVQYSYDFSDGSLGALAIGSKAKAASKEITNYTFTVNASQAVPVPAAAWLLGSGLAGLVAFRRRLN
jgi:hypothetical protein